MSDTDSNRNQMVKSTVLRYLLLVIGFIFVAVGFIGVLVPGLPTTVFMIMAAWCFAKSSPRFERWVLQLPGIGKFVQDHRSGLGMPRKSKIIAITMMSLAVVLSIVFALNQISIRFIVGTVGIFGVWYVGCKVPTREKVISQK
ncbi:MAG: YbaN family protein [Acidimicrobiales bacterium]|nr:YbaN family protein [Acidimicrobiales bacterium]|tara:strand:+ start:27 stop:455 length:429 start_codon:yes stop_codon:yes gene_type:complete